MGFRYILVGESRHIGSTRANKHPLLLSVDHHRVCVGCNAFSFSFFFLLVLFARLYTTYFKMASPTRMGPSLAYKSSVLMLKC